MRVGVVGCGAMGFPMALAMQSAGADIRGLDIAERDFGPLPVSADPGSLSDCAVVFVIVRDEAETEAVLFGPGAFLPHAGALRTLVISSTLSPRYVQNLRDRVPSHLALVDAPMSGAPIAAEERRLSFMLGGAQADIDPLWPLLGAMGESFHHVGPFGAGMTAKVLNNLVAASSVAATRTALSWGQASGLARETLLEIFADSSGQTWYGLNFERISWAEEGFDPGNTMGILKKDLACTRDLAPSGASTELLDTLMKVISRLEPS